MVISVFAGRAGPTAVQRELFTELGRRFGGLREEITLRLHGEYCDIRQSMRSQYAGGGGPGGDADFEKDFPAVDAPEDIWTIAMLYRIEVCGRRRWIWSWNDDHQLNVMVKDWRVVDVAMEG